MTPKELATKRKRFEEAFRDYVSSEPKGGLLSDVGLSTRLKAPKGETRDNVVIALEKYFGKKSNRAFYFNKKTGEKIATILSLYQSKHQN